MAIATAPDAELAYGNLLHQIDQRLAQMRDAQIHLIGIHSGGAWIAERLHRDLKLATPLGTLSSAFHRDDYSRRGLPGEMKATELPSAIAGADIILVDDILFTGRTVRAALNELFDYGRPKRVELAVLLDRGGRELPIEARYCGGVFPLATEQNYVLTRDPDQALSLRIE
jgi:pyrimidine operon attenuation protein / uracil phosphoribosyltransferase